jgi:hypothetical protein
MQLIPEKLIYPRKPKVGDTKSTKERSGKAKVIKLPSYLRPVDRRYERYGVTLCPLPFALRLFSCLSCFLWTHH